MRLIDADALMKSMYHRAFETDGDTMWQSGCWVRYRAIEQTVKEQPTIEPMRKKGKWIPHREKSREYIGTVLACVTYDYWLCDTCGYRVENGQPMYNFCPNCGAEMER